MGIVDASFDHPMKSEEKASMPLAGGIANMGYQCGMLWGAALAAGAESYRRYGPGSQAEAEAILASQKLMQAFRAHTKNEINCLEISHMNLQGNTELVMVLKFFLRGGPIACFRMAGRYAPDVYDEIESTFTEKHLVTPSSPVSCTAKLAEKLGVSELDVVMAAGLAGGIGLSGGGCGALGAAIWLKGLKQPVEIEGISYSGTWVNETVEKFLESSDYEFECSKIVGRQFESVDEHADYLRAGGCSNIIEGLATL